MNRGMDPLADLPGAEDFDALLAREELRRGRTGELLAVAMIDVDGLRRVNRDRGATAGPVTCSIGIADTAGDLTLIQAAAKAHRRMEVIQTMRKLRRTREGGQGQ